MTTHITYETAERLKEFLGKDAPEPMELMWWDEFENISFFQEIEKYPAYQLHDLLSKPFCEAMANRIPEIIVSDPMGTDEKINLGKMSWEDVSFEIYAGNKKGGLTAVEEALEEMMK